MTTQTLDKKELLNSVDEAVSGLLALISSLDENEVNIVPYPDSWTAGQLSRHVSKAIGGTAKVMSMESQPAERDPGERIPELKKMFLDFSTKMKAPGNVAPEEGPYEKQAMIAELDTAFKSFRENTTEANPGEMLTGLPFGPVTKWELSHFILYHTQRHLYQMKNICEALQKN